MKREAPAVWQLDGDINFHGWEVIEARAVGAHGLALLPEIVPRHRLLLSAPLLHMRWLPLGLLPKSLLLLLLIMLLVVRLR